MRISIALDCRDADLLAPFWCAAMNYRVDQRISQYVVLVPADDVPGPVFILQEVAEGKLARIECTSTFIRRIQRNTSRSSRH